MARWTLLLRTWFTVVTAALFAYFTVAVATHAPSHHRSLRAAGCHQTKHRHRPLKVEFAAFGTERFDDDGYAFVETDQIANAPDTPFGWRMQIATGDDAERVVVKEVLVLPKAPEFWGISSATTLSEDRTTATTTEVLQPQGGWIGNTWEVSPGDPSGPYRIEVYLNGEHAKTFHFTVK